MKSLEEVLLSNRVELSALCSGIIHQSLVFWFDQIALLKNAKFVNMVDPTAAPKSDLMLSNVLEEALGTHGKRTENECYSLQLQCPHTDCERESC